MYKNITEIEKNLEFIKNNCKSIKYLKTMYTDKVTLIYFDDLTTGSTIAVDIKDFSLDFLTDKLLKSRQTFKINRKSVK